MTIVGARPQLVKAAPLSRALLAAGAEDVIVHSGQHYDDDMSAVFFRELGIPEPAVQLGVGSGTHGRQTARMLEGIEQAILERRPDRVVVLGDTNSTLAGALAAAKLALPLAHVEAGLRSFNRAMPEEINRVVVDHISHLLLCPGPTAVRNLAAEGITRGVHDIGDVMADVLLAVAEGPARQSDILARLGLAPGGYLLATVHRAGNTDDPERLGGILAALATAREPVLFPVHPRTRQAMAARGLAAGGQVRVVAPLGYVDTVALLASCRLLLTDSGGMQKEAYWLGVPCLTMRDETEWVETVELGWNRLVGADRDRIREGIATFRPTGPRPPVYGDGHAAQRAAALIVGGEA